MKRPLEARVALVAGATRGAGRGIACVLGEAGAIVYCTGRSVRGKPAMTNRPETIEETAEMVTARGGEGIAVQTDHTMPEQVERLMKRIEREQKRLDIVINDLWAGGEVSWKRFGNIPIDDGLWMLERAVRAHVINDHYAVPLMMKTKPHVIPSRVDGEESGRRKRAPRPDSSRSSALGMTSGLIVEVTEGDGFYYRGHFYYDLARIAELRIAWDLAKELRRHKIAVVALTPGFMRTEMVLDSLKVSEENWRDAIPRRGEFAESETPYFIGRAILALAADPKAIKKSGRVFTSIGLAREYGFTDVDGRTPDVWSYMTAHMPSHRYKSCDDVFYSYW
ncbi:MAG TPA: SDR family NAD(P)-dependent oxidoreductase [Thermoanaerobaculia bacterium]|jgi:NAD(P)-dependent dehydrogenase (short-subunit alcohol dehydrogenase family)|nr:SDR family NAD(P)-dependent oxidoreductase [Thermoanaerobaculia bacterium]